MAAIWRNIPRSLSQSHNPISLIASLTGAECDQYTRKVSTSVARTTCHEVQEEETRTQQRISALTHKAGMRDELVNIGMIRMTGPVEVQHAA